jgi:hypothetical protein
MCKCGCNTCDTKSTALVLKESKFVHTPISEGLKYHIDNKIPLNENIYRIGSKEYMKLYEEARSLYSRNKLDVSEDDKYFLTETHVGNFGMFEGKRVPLDIPMLNEYLTESMIGIKTKANFKPIQLKGALERAGIEGFRMDRLSWSLTALKLDKKYFNDAKQIINDLGLSIMMAKESKLNEYSDEDNDLSEDDIAQAEFGMDYDQLGPNEKEWVRDEYENITNFNRVNEILDEKLKGIDGKACWKGYKLSGTKKKDGKTVDNCIPMEEAEFKGKEVALGKPKRGGSKAYYVYVKDGDKVKKVSFGSGGLRAKIKNKDARSAFAARHNCDKKKDRTTAGYWSCNLPRYAKQLGLGANMNTYW